VSIEVENNETDVGSSADMDVSHTKRLSATELKVVQEEADRFLARMNRFFDEAYIHVDVSNTKEGYMGLRGLEWRVLLVTNRGRYHATFADAGVEASIRGAFGVLEQQVLSRLER
jgi:hypothetical protein